MNSEGNNSYSVARKNLQGLVVGVIISALAAGSMANCQRTDAGRYSAEGPVVLDNRTQLMWSRCSLGQTYTDNQCTGTASAHSLAQARQLASSADIGGYSDWRVPTIDELETLVDSECSYPVVSLDVFPNTPVSFYASTTPFRFGTYRFMYLYSGTGEVRHDDQNNYSRVRLVRRAGSN
ncbi:MAG: DUF1566 domain-containing protein [Natronospirillum sp.]|uniref:Lcl C-terminal domain-containing protein n=1 Tax=Natronospirillum sp. TaxID=2812955 RepID=UPI0025DF5CD0|nr:DUF1566 domain-containing protein [Natronospirillum sp.]MCH8551150.1 DUF1566 domain-containing protein [Natronospirillum sp.]